LELFIQVEGQKGQRGVFVAPHHIVLATKPIRNMLSNELKLSTCFQTSWKDQHMKQEAAQRYTMLF